MLAPRQTGRLLLSVSDCRTRRTPVECRCITAAARVPPGTVDVVSLRGGGLHPRGLPPALSILLDGDITNFSRGELTVLRLPVIVGGDVQGLADLSATLAGDRG